MTTTIQKISPSQFEVTSSLSPDSKMKVTMQERDRMVSASFENLPEDRAVRLNIFQEFRTALYEQFGGKTSLSFESKKYYDELIIAGFTLQKVEDGALFTTRLDLMTALAELKDKPKVKSIVEEIERKESEFEFLSVPQDFIARSLELYHFKKRNAVFVTPDKESKGIYSVTAENSKTNNPFTQHFSITHKGKIIANSMIYTQDNIAYECDIMVENDEAYRNKGFRQACIYLAYSHLLKLHPNLKGTWVIAGGDGQKAQGQHLAIDILKGKPITHELAKEQGFFISFMKPGPVLLLEANCDPKTQLSQDRVITMATSSTASILSGPPPASKLKTMMHAARERVATEPETVVSPTPTLAIVKPTAAGKSSNRGLFAALAVGAATAAAAIAISALALRRKGVR